jgi:hypothetical protein
MLNASLSFLSRGRTTTRQVCRVCHEIAELKTEGLCHECSWVKTQIHLRVRRQPSRPIPSDSGDPSQLRPQCKRIGCLCVACNRRILDLHPFRPADPDQAHAREIHLHPRCHDLWLEAIGVVVAEPPPSPTTE